MCAARTRPVRRFHWSSAFLRGAACTCVIVGSANLFHSAGRPERSVGLLRKNGETPPCPSIFGILSSVINDVKASLAIDGNAIGTLEAIAFRKRRGAPVGVTWRSSCRGSRAPTPNVTAHRRKRFVLHQTVADR